MGSLKTRSLTNSSALASLDDLVGLRQQRRRRGEATPGACSAAKSAKDEVSGGAGRGFSLDSSSRRSLILAY
jgi:hypothetical protein